MRFLLVSVLGLISLTARVAYAGEDVELRNWVAPPYWAGSSADGLAATSESGPLAASRVPSHTEELDAVPTPALAFVGITPCRVADTRDATMPAGYGPPSMPASLVRNFTLPGRCGIPVEAQAVSFNFTVTNTIGSGFLLAYPTAGAQATVSTLNYLPGQTVANAAVVPLGAGGAISVVPGVSGFDLILDVNGYYAPLSIVSALNGISGPVTIVGAGGVSVQASGSTVTLTSPSGTITGVTTGAGLTGGGTSGSVTVSVPTSGIQASMIASGAIDASKIATGYGLWGRNAGGNLHASTTVGIGTSNPSATYMLDVNGSLNATTINYSHYKICHMETPYGATSDIIVPISVGASVCNTFAVNEAYGGSRCGCVFSSGTRVFGAWAAAGSVPTAPSPNCGW